MGNNKKLQFLLTMALILLFGVVVYLGYQALQPPGFGDRGDDEVADAAASPREPYVSPRTDGVLEPGSGDVIAGGVERPATDLSQKVSEADGDRRASGEEADDGWSYGQTPAVSPDANEQVASVYEVIENRERDPHTYAKAVSSLAAADMFDAVKFEKDVDYRASYLNTPQPSRVFQVAQPGPGVPKLRRMTPVYQEVVQGEETQLKVRAVPGAPVTFSSFDLGRFENELTTITVEADATGVAEVAFWGPLGKVDDVNILAASPVTSGQEKLIVHVTR
ncbi:MAG: hypothetical protein AAGB26_15070 [Planctomycetota bacterium]